MDHWTSPDKQTGRTFSEQMIFEDNGDDGDSYNYSPPRELYVSSKDLSSATSQCLKRLAGRAHCQLTLTVPYDLEERSQQTVTTSPRSQRRWH
ncbi:hypothetical protein ACEQPO_01110 [Bacillus sp. SL00103]